MKNLKFWIKLLLYLSLAFLLYYLVQFDYLVFNNITFNYYMLMTSILLLWAGFFVSTISWRIALKTYGHKISQNMATHSHGISVFAKYIPGKLWVILGRASVACSNKAVINIYSTISLKEQLIYLLVGLIVSFLALLFVPIQPLITLAVFMTILGLSLFLFSKKIHHILIRVIEYIFKKNTNLPFIGLRASLPIAISTFTYWCFWSIGFFIFCRSISPNVHFLAAFAFPLSVSYGLLAIFIPGGIGVREGIIVLFLSSLGIDVALATTISVLSRLWFISGELFLFLLAIFIKKKRETIIN